MSLLNRTDSYGAPPFWHNGPAPGALYNFPGTTSGSWYNSSSSSSSSYGVQHTQNPIVTGTSVVGLHFKEGVMLAADVLGSYGRLAKFRACERVVKVNDNIIMGVGGDYADYQYLKSIIDQKIIDETCLDDGFSLKPNSLYCWLTRVMYNRRSSFDPLWNNYIIAGLEDGKPFLGSVDKLGTAFVNPYIATGYGGYMATPLLAKAYEANPEMSEDEAAELMYKAMQVLFYRDAQSFPKYHLGIITKERGVEIRGPITLESNWDIATFNCAHNA